MKLLSDYAADVNSQFGEDGIIEFIFSLIGERSRNCVEFGAGDGTSCSNTKKLWQKEGWRALLIEGDSSKQKALKEVTHPFENCQYKIVFLQPSGPNSIDSVVAEHGFTEVDFMSIDVDGPDWQIWHSMIILRPRVICVEYNQSIPPEWSVHQEEFDDYLGSSAKALVDLAKVKGYELVGLNKGNLFFVVKEELAPFEDFERDLLKIFPYEDLTYVATDYAGRYFSLGKTPPWGISDRCYMGNLGGPDADEIKRFTPPPAWSSANMLGISTESLVKAFEWESGTLIQYIGQNWEVAPSVQNPTSIEAFRRAFAYGDKTIVMNVANQSDIKACMWVEPLGEAHGYKMKVIGSELFVFTKDENV